MRAHAIEQAEKVDGFLQQRLEELQKDFAEAETQRQAALSAKQHQLLLLGISFD